MDFDFFLKMVCTISFAGVTFVLCIKWIVEAYLDYIQVTTGIKVLTLTQMKDMKGEEEDDAFTD